MTDFQKKLLKKVGEIFLSALIAIAGMFGVQVATSCSTTGNIDLNVDKDTGHVDGNWDINIKDQQVK